MISSSRSRATTTPRTRTHPLEHALAAAMTPGVSHRELRVYVNQLEEAGLDAKEIYERRVGIAHKVRGIVLPSWDQLM